jgi:hypothetical protein
MKEKKTSKAVMMKVVVLYSFIKDVKKQVCSSKTCGLIFPQRVCSVHIIILFQKECETHMACIYIPRTSKLEERQQLIYIVHNVMQSEISGLRPGIHRYAWHPYEHSVNAQTNHTMMQRIGVVTYHVT